LGFPVAGSPAYDRPPEPEPPLASPEVRALLERLLQGQHDKTSELRVTERSERFHASRGTSEGTWSRLILRSADSWFLRDESQAGPALERSLVGPLVTSLDAGARLARSWEAGPEARLSVADLRRALGLPHARDLEGAVVTLGPVKEAGLSVLRISRPPSQEQALWTLRDSDGALLEQTQAYPGRRSGKRVFSAHVLVGGLSWPGVIEDFDEQGRRVQRVEVKIEALEAQAYASAFAEVHRGREDVIVLGPATPTLREARAALAQGKAGLEERLVLTLDRLAASRADEAWRHLETALAPHAAKPGVAWLRAALMAQTRQQAELKRHLNDVLTPAIAARPSGRWGLSERALGLASSVLGAEELLALHAKLAPIATDTGKNVEARWAWRWREVGLLAQAGRVVEARGRIARLAAERPHDLSAQMQHVQALAQAGEPDQAVEQLGRVIADGPWLAAERDALEGQRSDWRLERMRYEPLLAELAAWAEASPETSEPWVRRASILYVLGKGDEADAWLRSTLSSVGRGPTSTASERAQLQAAIQVAHGGGWNFWSQEFVALFAAELAEAARFHIQREDDRHGLSTQILEDWRFSQLAAAKALKDALRREAAEPAALAAWGHERLASQLQLVGWGKDAVDEALYTAVQAGLEARRVSAETFGERQAWAGLLATIAGQRQDEERVLGVRRREREAAQGRARRTATQALLSALLQAKHSAAHEDEVQALVVELAQNDESEARRLGRAGTQLRQLVAWALPARAEALLGTPEERAKRSRVVAREAERESRRKARAALAERLASTTWPESARPWATLERLALLSENRESLEQVAEGALALLSPPPGNFATLPREHPLAQVGRVLEARAAWLLTHAATRRGAPETLAARVLEASEARWALERHDWRYESFRLLVALDRVPDLERVLAQWAGPDDVDALEARQAAWPAELGRPAEAAAAFEALKGLEGALSAGDYETLATWYLVAGDGPRREAAVKARFEVLGEWELRNWLQAQRRGATGPGGVPGDLPPEVYPALSALLRKAAFPQNHVWVVQNLYQSTKDHRILAALAEGVVGHSAQSVYGYPASRPDRRRARRGGARPAARGHDRGPRARDQPARQARAGPLAAHRSRAPRSSC
jgi:hypothetical protein